MDRYEILTQSESELQVHKPANTRNSAKLCNIMKGCIDHNYILDVSEISNDEIIDRGLVILSKRIRTPIVTGTEKSAALFKVMHKHSDVYYIERLPEKYVEVLAYHDLDVSKHSHLKPLLIVKK